MSESTFKVDGCTDFSGAQIGPVVLHTHRPFQCKGEHCVIHNPSDHHMREWPTNWRADRCLMERICAHGVGHPDPDDPSMDRVHGCDFCCVPPKGRAARRAEKRRLASEFVESVNSRTVCAECGAQPIEWHGEHHPEKPNARISSLRAQGASVARIQREMELCVPLCRRCHMTADGRLTGLKGSQPRQAGAVVTLPSPCSCCGRPTKPMRNGMCATCDNHHSGRRLRRTESCDGCCSA